MKGVNVPSMPQIKWKCCSLHLSLWIPGRKLFWLFFSFKGRKFKIRTLFETSQNLFLFCWLYLFMQSVNRLQDPTAKKLKYFTAMNIILLLLPRYDKSILSWEKHPFCNTKSWTASTTCRLQVTFNNWRRRGEGAVTWVYHDKMGGILVLSIGVKDGREMKMIKSLSAKSIIS